MGSVLIFQKQKDVPQKLIFQPQIGQVSQAKLLGVFLTPTYSILTQVNYITGIMNQRLQKGLKLFKVDDVIEHSYKQLFCSNLRSDHCLNELLPPRKYYFGRNLRKKGHGLELPLAKTERIKSNYLMRCVYRYA